MTEIRIVDPIAHGIFVLASVRRQNGFEGRLEVYDSLGDSLDGPCGVAFCN